VGFGLPLGNVGIAVILVLNLVPSGTTSTVPVSTTSCNVAVIAPKTVVMVLRNVIVWPSEVVISSSTRMMVVPPNSVTISGMLVVVGVGCGGGV